MLSYAQERERRVVGQADVKRVVFDLDGVLIKEKSSWSSMKRIHNIPEVYPLFRRGKISLQESLGFLESAAKDVGLCRSDFVSAANTAPLEDHASEVVERLNAEGVGLDIATFSPTIYARVVANRIHPRAFLRPVISVGPVPMNVYGRTTVFDSQGQYVSTYAYPNGAGQPWENQRDLNKKIVLDTIAARWRIESGNILFVSDGGDTEASLYYPTIGYKHAGDTLRTIAEISDLRDLLRFV